MEYQITIQETPNPTALKFILNVPVKTEGNVTYKNAEECANNPLAQQLFTIGNISELFFFDNYITVTQDSKADWNDLQNQIRAVILDNIADHDPNFQVSEPKTEAPANSDPELAKIESILDQTIRPALQMDGGDLRLINLEGNILKISYSGACGCCPHAAMGTLSAIENVLRAEYNPEIAVQMG